MHRLVIPLQLPASYQSILDVMSRNLEAISPHAPLQPACAALALAAAPGSGLWLSPVILEALGMSGMHGTVFNVESATTALEVSLDSSAGDFEVCKPSLLQNCKHYKS